MMMGNQGRNTHSSRGGMSTVLMVAATVLISACLGRDRVAADIIVTTGTPTGTNQLTRFDDNGSMLGVVASGTSVDLPGASTLGPGGDLFVVGHNSNQILRFDSQTGASKGVFASGGGMRFPYGIAFAPGGGDLFVTSSGTDQVLRFDGSTGGFKGVFASGGMRNPVPLRFGTGGDLFVASYDTDEIYRFDGSTGASKGVFASGGGLRGPYDMTFGPNGDLFVLSAFSNNELEYDGSSGAYKGIFATGGGLSEPSGLTFGPGGDLFVSSNGTSRVLRYDGRTGAFVGIFVSLAPTTSTQALLYVPSAVPEPSSIALFGGGAVGLFLARRRLKSRRNASEE